jgi:hypothetical protein
MRTTWPQFRRASADIVIVPKSSSVGQMDLLTSFGHFNSAIPDQNAEARQFEQEQQKRREETEAN